MLLAAATDATPCCVLPSTPLPRASAHTRAGPEGEDLPVQLLPVPNTTLALQQLMAAVNATCPTTFGDAGGCWQGRIRGWPITLPE